jgi:hypothetical protein
MLLPCSCCFGAGWKAISATAARISAGTTASNTELGSSSSRMPPITAPIVVPMPRIPVRRPWPRSSARYPIDPLTPPGTSPMQLETFAVTGE